MARVCHDAALKQRTASHARTAHATSKGPMNGSMWEGVAASCAARPSVEPAAGAGHDRYRLLDGTEANGHSVRPACDASILWQAHKARAEVDTLAEADVKRHALTTQCRALARRSFCFAVVARNGEG
jgi:hypothetical protein